MSQLDWRLPENRREGFQRFYSFHLKYRSHPGCVYTLLPAIAERYDLDEDQKAWLVWLNGNTQNVVSSLLLLREAPRPEYWKRAVEFWNDNFKLLEWDTDRRHQKSKFGVATEKRMENWDGAFGWQFSNDVGGWDAVWKYAKSQPYMGRLSAWSMTEYARILLGPESVPDASSFLLEDVSGSRSHRNGLATILGYDAWSWEAGEAQERGIFPYLNNLAESLLEEAYGRNLVQDCYCPAPYAGCTHDPQPHPDVSRLTMESALCTYKSHFKVNRRYPNVYSDMMYNRIKKAESRFGEQFGLLWETRRKTLPAVLRLEDQPYDPGLRTEKQNHFRLTGEFPLLYRDYEDMEPSGFDREVGTGKFGVRKDPKW